MLDVVELLARSGNARLRFSDIVRELDLNQATAHAILKTLCAYDPARLTALAGRFSAPVFPGETIRTEIWSDGGVASFRARVVERDVVALNNGRAEIKG